MVVILNVLVGLLWGSFTVFCFGLIVRACSFCCWYFVVVVGFCYDCAFA